MSHAFILGRCVASGAMTRLSASGLLAAGVAHPRLTRSADMLDASDKPPMVAVGIRWRLANDVSLCGPSVVWHCPTVAAVANWQRLPVPPLVVGVASGRPSPSRLASDRPRRRSHCHANNGHLPTIALSAIRRVAAFNDLHVAPACLDALRVILLRRFPVIARRM